MNQAHFEVSADKVFLLKGVLTADTVMMLLGHGLQYIQSQANPSISLEQVERSDSTGIALLLAWKRAAKSAGKSLTIAPIPQQMQTIASVSGVSEFL